MPILQLAIDVINLSRAKKIAEESIKGGIDWIEVGTPLIKSEGMKAIRELSKEFPNKKIVADMKTMDTGSLEVEIAAKSGADIVAILGTASDSTIREAVSAGKKYNSKIMVDLIGVNDVLERTRKLMEFDIDYLLLHTGIDEQMAGADPLDKLKEVFELTDIPLGIAGGIDEKTAPKAVKSGAEIIVVGGAIVRSENPLESTKEIKRSINEINEAPRKSEKKEKRNEIVEKISTANLSDALHRKGVMKSIKKRSGNKSKIFGRALTVETLEGDWAKPVEALESAQKHDVLVINASGKELAVWGELASNSAQNKGVEGVIIDGAVRDLRDIRELGFPVWSKYVSPEAGEPKGYGEIGAEIKCGGIDVQSGDFILADEDGVVVIPKERVNETLNRAKMVYENEERVRKEIREGETLSEVIELNKWEKDK